MTNEMIFYTGIVGAAAAFIFEIACLITAKIKWIRLEARMDQEYGIQK